MSACGDRWALILGEEGGESPAGVRSACWQVGHAATRIPTLDPDRNKEPSSGARTAVSLCRSDDQGRDHRNATPHIGRTGRRPEPLGQCSRARRCRGYGISSPPVGVLYDAEIRARIGTTGGNSAAPCCDADRKPEGQPSGPRQSGATRSRPASGTRVPARAAGWTR